MEASAVEDSETTKKKKVVDDLLKSEDEEVLSNALRDVENYYTQYSGLEEDAGWIFPTILDFICRPDRTQEEKVSVIKRVIRTLLQNHYDVMMFEYWELVKLKISCLSDFDSNAPVCKELVEQVASAGLLHQKTFIDSGGVDFYVNLAKSRATTLVRSAALFGLTCFFNGPGQYAEEEKKVFSALSCIFKEPAPEDVLLMACRVTADMLHRNDSLTSDLDETYADLRRFLENASPSSLTFLVAVRAITYINYKHPKKILDIGRRTLEDIRDNFLHLTLQPKNSMPRKEHELFKFNFMLDVCYFISYSTRERHMEVHKILVNEATIRRLLELMSDDNFLMETSPASTLSDVITFGNSGDIQLVTTCISEVTGRMETKFAWKLAKACIDPLCGRLQSEDPIIVDNCLKMLKKFVGMHNRKRKMTPIDSEDHQLRMDDFLEKLIVKADHSFRQHAHKQIGKPVDIVEDSPQEGEDQPYGEKSTTSGALNDALNEE